MSQLVTILISIISLGASFPTPGMLPKRTYKAWFEAHNSHPGTVSAHVFGREKDSSDEVYTIKCLYPGSAERFHTSKEEQGIQEAANVVKEHVHVHKKLV